MRASRLVVSFILFAFFCSSAFSQIPTPEAQPSPAEPEKDKARQELEKNAFRLLDEAVGDANGLKLWENRALIYAVAGDLYWKTEQKRARKLFRDACIGGRCAGKPRGSGGYFKGRLRLRGYRTEPRVSVSRAAD
jgi:hypothetical protein